jgi:hypothetical protein
MGRMLQNRPGVRRVDPPLRRANSTLRRAEPALRHRPGLLVFAAVCIGALLIMLLERYRVPLRDWVLANPGASAGRRQLVVVLLVVALFAPLLALAGRLWSHTDKGVSRGPLLHMLAMGCCIACAALAVLLWRLLTALSF